MQTPRPAAERVPAGAHRQRDRVRSRAALDCTSESLRVDRRSREAQNRTNYTSNDDASMCVSVRKNDDRKAPGLDLSILPAA